jgi:hypothetical protein
MRACQAVAMAMATSSVETLGLAFGVGALAIALLLAGLLAMLGADDRRGLIGMLRHPLKAAFAEPDRPDEDDEDY